MAGNAAEFNVVSRGYGDWVIEWQEREQDLALAKKELELAAKAATLLGSRPHPNYAGAGVVGLNAIAVGLQDPTLSKIATAVGTGYSIYSDLQNNTYQKPVYVVDESGKPVSDLNGSPKVRVEEKTLPGQGFVVAGTALTGLATITDSKELAAAGVVASGIGDTTNAIATAGAGAGAATAVSAAGTLASLFINDPTASKIVNVVTTGASLAAQAITGALSVATSAVSAGLGAIGTLASTLIGGRTGQVIGSVLGIGAGAAMIAGAAMMAVPVLGWVAGAVTIIGSLLGLFGGGPSERRSLLSETLSSDLRGDGTADDLIIRGGIQNTLKIKHGDGDGERTMQMLRVSGWYDDPQQSLQAQVVELTGDATPEIVFQDKDEISVFVNRGDGTFGNPDYATSREARKQELQELRTWSEIVFDDLPGAWSGEQSGSLTDYYNQNGGVEKFGELSAWVEGIRVDLAAESERLSQYGSWDSTWGRDSVVAIANVLESHGIAKPKELDHFLTAIASSELQIGGVQASIESSNASFKGVALDAAAKDVLKLAQYGYRDRDESTVSVHFGEIPSSDDIAEGWGQRDHRGASSEEEWLAQQTARSQQFEDYGSWEMMEYFLADHEEQSMQDFDAGFEGLATEEAREQAREDGSGVSLPTQEFAVDIDKQAPGQVHFWDVNGDANNDLIFGGEKVQGITAFLGLGDGTFDTTAPINLQNPGDIDLDRLSINRDRAQLLAVDLYGQGLFTYLAKTPQGWAYLSEDEQPADEAAWEALHRDRPPIDEAQRKYEEAMAASQAAQAQARAQADTQAAQLRQLAWDVNGDGRDDLVDYGPETLRAYLQLANGQFDSNSVNLLDPTDEDLSQLITIGPDGAQYLKVSIDGGENYFAARVNLTIRQFEATK
jgi:hypothetical protein